MEFVRYGAFSLTWPAATQTGRLWVPETLTFNARPSTIPFLWKWVLFAWEWIVISISKDEHLTSFWYRGLLVWNTTVPAVLLFLDTNVAAVTSCEKALFQLSSQYLKPYGVKWELLSSTFTWYYLFFSILQNEIWTFCRTLTWPPLAVKRSNPDINF